MPPHQLGHKIISWSRQQLTERGWRNFFIVLVLIGTTAPHIVGWMFTPTGERYLARGPVVAADSAVYYGAMLEASRGNLLVSNPFTSEPQQARLFQPLWLVGGWIVALTRLPVEVVFQLYRLVFVLGFVGMLWWLTSLISTVYRQRLIPFVILVLSSGLGWVGYIFFRQGTSFDLWVSESNSFLTMMHSPLFMASQMLMVWCIWRWWQMITSHKNHWWWGLGVAVLGLLHPYDLLTVAVVCVFSLAVVAAQWRLRWAHLRMVGLGLLWVVPIAVYYWWVLQEPVLQGWARQNIDLTKSFRFVLLGAGLLLPLAILGAWSARRRSMTWVIPWVLWIGAAGILIFLPGISFQRRLINGVHIPLALLAGLAWQYISTQRGSPWRRYGGAALVFLLSITNVAVVVRHIVSITFTNRATYPVYLSNDEQAGIEAVQKFLPPSEAVWTNPWFGNAVAGLTGHPVVLGHGHQTIQVGKKIDWWEVLISPQSTSEQRAGIIQQSSRWLLWETKDQSGTYQPGLDDHWKTIWSRPSVQLYYWVGENGTMVEPTT